jgi:BON domain
MAERDRNDVEKEIGDPEARLADEETEGNPVLESDRLAAGEIEPDFSQSDANTPAEAIEDGEIYTPPIDPVVGTDAEGRTEVLGGTSPSALDADIVPAPSAEDARPGDEALIDAIREHLRLDASTSALEQSVDVAVRQGVAFLAGRVDGPEDVDNVEAVVASVPGVVDVVEQLTVSSL